MPIKQVCLFPAHPPEFVHRQGYLFPPRFRIDVSDSPDFEVAATIISFEKSSFPNPGNNAITFTGGNRAGRYVRLTALELSNSLSFFRFALAEMQVWSNGTNVALGKSVTASDSFEKDGWSRAALVDGFNSQANIVDWSPWLAALSQRRELSQQLAELEQQSGVALNRLVAAGMWSAAGLVIVAFSGLFFFLWKQRWQRRRELERCRVWHVIGERAADADAGRCHAERDCERRRERECAFERERRGKCERQRDSDVIRFCDNIKLVQRVGERERIALVRGLALKHGLAQRERLQQRERQCAHLGLRPRVAVGHCVRDWDCGAQRRSMPAEQGTLR
jgi:hypothetical protein